MVLNDKYIVLVKAPKENEIEDRYIQILENSNFKVRVVKSLDFNYINLEILEEKLSNPDKYSGLIFTSPRCVEGVKKALKLKPLHEKWLDKHNFVVGVSTKDCARLFLNITCQGEQTGNAENLSKYILEQAVKYKKPFLVPHGNLKSDTLSTNLINGGLQLDEVVVYESIPSPHTYEDFIGITSNLKEIPSFIVFFSPSAVKSCSRLLLDLEECKDIQKISIGPSTQKELEAQGQIVDGICTKPTPEDLLKVINDLTENKMR